LAAAFTKTLEYRKPWETNECASWTGSFSAKFWARLGDGQMLQTVFDKHFEQALFPNLTSNFRGSWEIDGNLGIMSAIAEMLLQSHTSEIVLLPALPSKYPNGEVKGLRARNGFEVDMKWENSKLTDLVIYSEQGKNCQLRYKDKTLNIKLAKGEKSTLTINSFQQ